jgi:protein involved in polysaccharide export with SLBB domain
MEGNLRAMLKLAHLATVGLVSIGCASANAGQGPSQAQAVERASTSKPTPGDKIYLHILREPLLSDTVTVDERGQAAFPKVGAMNVGAMSVGELSDSLRHRYAEFLRTPELEIVVLRRVIVNGEVRQPNVYLLPVSSTVADLIARAGGFTEAAKRNEIHLMRSGMRREIVGWDMGGALGTELVSGDQLIVGRRSWLALNVFPAVSTVMLLASIIISARR